ncbi:MAG: M67 family metallopeptidase [Gemmataceae bacterium]|nr:M67 family metallopeptidase [Gemmata sp.]MDW8196314.1 M67 family metallopeptidase [Gemmataceae bacterium]
MPPFRCLVLPAVIYEEVIGHAQREWPRECCGVLAGQIAEGVAQVTARYAITNDAAEVDEFATNPRDLLNAFRAMRTMGSELVAIYHSHPNSEPVPSRRDLERNTYGESVVHLIVGLVNSGPQVRAWWLGPTCFREASCAVIGPTHNSG